MYANRIDRARKTLAVVFAISGFGFVLSRNLNYVPGAIILGKTASACLVAVFGLFVEYLVRSWVETRKIRRSQFTLAGLTGTVSAVALTLGIFRLLGAATIVVWMFAVVVLACAIELIRQQRTGSRTRE